MKNEAVAKSGFKNRIWHDNRLKSFKVVSLFLYTQNSTRIHLKMNPDIGGGAEFDHELLGLGRSKTMGEFMGWKLTVQAEALIYVVVPSVIMP